MAELSAETVAIIDRLKAEGDLVRNSGTNSLRSMNIKFDKFQGLFQSINANVIEQTNLMQKQMGLAVDASERLRTQEQFDEVQQPSVVPETNNDSEKATDAKIEGMGDKIASAITMKNAMGTMKNLAIGAASAFVGYNLLKGFIDENYNGAFTEMEGGIATLGPKLSDFAETGFDDIKTAVTDMNSRFDELTGPDGSLASLSKSTQEIADKMNEIANMTWVDVAKSAIGQIGLVTLGFAALRMKLNNMRMELNAGTRTVNGQTWWQRTLGTGAKVPTGGTPVAPTTGSGRGNIVEQRGARADYNASRAAAGAAPKPANAGGTPRATVTSTQAANQAMRQAATQLPGPSGGPKFSLDANGRLQKPGGGGFASDADALKALQDSLDPRYSKVFGRLVALFKMVKIAASVYLMYEVYLILNDDKLYPTRNSKIEAMAPYLGSIVGGLGGAAIGGAMGSIPPLTGWGTLIGGLAGGIAGSFAGGWLGGVIAKWAFEEDPTESDREDVLAATGQNVSPRPTSQGGRNKFQTRWDDRYGATHNTDGTLMSPAGGRGNTVEGPGDRFPQYYKEGANGTGAGYTPPTYNEVDENGRLILYDAFGNPAAINDIQNNGPLGRMLRGEVDLSMGGAGGSTIVNAPVIAPSPVTVTNGGSQVTQVAFSGGGGSAGGPSLTIYGLTGSIA